MNAQEINKTLDKAHDYTNSILQEMDGLYLPEQIPYFLHVWLLQAAYGLRHHGFQLADIQNLILEEFKPAQDIAFDDVLEALPNPRSLAHEAWEFRFLFSEYEVSKRIYVDADEAIPMLRLTFPMSAKNGRGRVWLKRSESQEKLDKTDLRDFVRIVEQIRDLSGLEVVVTSSAHHWLVKTIAASEFFEHPNVSIAKRGDVR
ncbi:hypothetical protein ICN19_02025 [Polynucleobacter sp. AP-Capit-er-40B-B4]|uniref:hypothetical protein n=1 Tax=Polynucleobacter sp. AP-Capit-er-40B-B4 TaxID=2576927 RepID=UPI001C0DCF14|nr:hypothetical protein [Polynucleobacter sp. AP-Capit-er-40B-B4]MBU3580790.1 hypothetical protein [Polynucleobacter sp. AP-Capit-er-40B-B4]